MKQHEVIPEDVAWKLQQSDGYMDLRMWARSREALASIPMEHWDRTDFRKLRLRLALAEHDWPYAALLASNLREDEPDEPRYWIQLAQAMRLHMNVEEARHILREALGRFPEKAAIAFDLACCECRMGNPHQALRYLDRAIRIDPVYRNRALEHTDLQPLWSELACD